MKRLHKLMGTGLTGAMLACISPAQATMITFDLGTFTGDAATLRVTLDDTVNTGFITVSAEVVQPPIGDIRGIFFNLLNDPGLTASHFSGTDITEVQTNTSNLGNGANVNPAGPFDFGVEIGTQGIGGDDIQMTQFMINNLLGALVLADFGDFAGRLTSVGPDREGSSKLSGTPGTPGGNPPPTSVPEPGSLALLTLGLLGLGMSGVTSRRRAA